MPHKSFTKTIILFSFMLSALFGGYFIYQTAKNEKSANQQQFVAQKQQLAKGELAAFIFNTTPIDLPAVKFLDPQGAEIDLSAFKNKTILLNLWATWCGPCRHEMPTLDALQAKLGSDKFEVVTLNVDRKSVAGAEAFFSEIGIKSLKLYADPTTKAMRTLRARGLPMTMLINPDGQEVGRLFGPAEWMSEDAINLIQAELDSHI